MLWANFWFVSVLADGDSGAVAVAEKSSGLDWPTIISGLVGGLVVAVANHLFTNRRERGKWLRELQVKANQEFYSASQAFMDYVIDGYSEHPLTPDGAVEGSDGDEIAKRRTTFNRKGLDLIPVAREGTLEVARKATRLFPRLAYLAVPLSKSHHQAAEFQRGEAIKQLSALLENIGVVMRDEVGLIGWRRRSEVRKARQAIDSMEIECDVDTDDPMITLRAWAVRSATGRTYQLRWKSTWLTTFPAPFPTTVLGPKDLQLSTAIILGNSASSRIYPLQSRPRCSRTPSA